MHKKIIIKAFDKARKEAQKKGINHPSNNSLAKILSDYISIEFNTPIGERRLRDYYKSAIRKGINNEGDININQLNVVIGLCKYLGYEGFEDFVLHNSTKNISISETEELHIDTVFEKEKFQRINERINIYVKKNRIVLSISMAILILFLTIISLNRQRWMKWQNDHYVEVTFNSEEFKNGILKIYKEERIALFKKVIPDCSTLFFLKNGNEAIWYGKNGNGTLEYFTALGLHPETGTTLKKITPYIIKKHICPSY